MTHPALTPAPTPALITTQLPAQTPPLTPMSAERTDRWFFGSSGGTSVREPDRAGTRPTSRLVNPTSVSAGTATTAASPDRAG
jgi:hypothetical protein